MWVCGCVGVGGWVCCECVGVGVCCEYVLCVFVSTVHVCTCKYVSVGVLSVFVHVCISVCVYLCIRMYLRMCACVLFGWMLWMCYRCLSIYVHVCLTFLEGCTPLWYHCSCHPCVSGLCQEGMVSQGTGCLRYAERSDSPET